MRKKIKKSISGGFVALLAFAVFMITFFVTTFGQQVKIVGKGGSGNLDFDPSAILELDASKQGFLLPRLGNVDSVYTLPGGNPPEGLFIYATSDSSLYYRTKNRWLKLRTTSGTGSYFNLSQYSGDSVVVWGGDSLRYRTIADLITDPDATKALAVDSLFTTTLATDSQFVTILARDTLFKTALGRDTLSLFNTDTLRITESLLLSNLRERANDSVLVWDGDTVGYRTIADLVTDPDATKALAVDSLFTTTLATDSQFVTILARDTLFKTALGRDTLSLFNTDTLRITESLLLSNLRERTNDSVLVWDGDTVGYRTIDFSKFTSLLDEILPKITGSREGLGTTTDLGTVLNTQPASRTFISVINSYLSNDLTQEEADYIADNRDLFRIRIALGDSDNARDDIIEWFTLGSEQTPQPLSNALTASYNFEVTFAGNDITATATPPAGRNAAIRGMTIDVLDGVGGGGSLFKVLSEGNNAGDQNIVNVDTLGIGTVAPEVELDVAGQIRPQAGFVFSEKVISTTSTIAPADYLVMVDATSGGVTVTLPTVASVPKGKVIRIRKRAGGLSNAVTIEAANIKDDSDNSIVIYSDRTELGFYSDGTEWVVQ